MSNKVIDNNLTTLKASMNNLDATRIGVVALEVGTQKEGVGDSIDRGLILRRRLEEEGYGIVKLNKTKGSN